MAANSSLSGRGRLNRRGEDSVGSSPRRLSRTHWLSTSADSASSNRTVLVADDDAATRGLIRAALEPDGWTVEEAVDGVHACEVLERVQPEIVLLDVGMPNLDGFEACARMRTLGPGQQIPIMMVTVVDDQDSVGRAFEVGATDFLSKPFNFTILRQRLQYMYRAQQDRCQLRNERDFAAAVVDHSTALVVILDLTGRIVRFNQSCECVSRMSSSEAKGKLIWDILSSPEERDRERVAFECLVSERGTNRYEGSWTNKDGSRHEIAWSNSVLLNSDGDVEYVVCTGLDITDLTQAEEKVRFLASYDPLTGLPNRRLLAERLEQAITDAAGQQLAVLVLDLDHFKDVNSTWGHAGGDQLLMQVADRLTKSLRLSDVLVRHDPGLSTELGRLGGDEFTALLRGVSDAAEVAAIVERLQHALGRPFTYQDQKFTVTASVGAALYPADGSDSDTLLGNAESAMHAARKQMRGSSHFYSVAMQTNVSERLSLEYELRQAVERDELRLHYQEKVFTRSSRISGAEALVRWQHPSRGLMAPASFLDVAEETGLIVPIGEWVLRQACSQVMSWLESGLRVVPVSVNLSSVQFHGADLLSSIASILNETTLTPSYLAVEITESMIMRDTREAHEILCRLNELGVHVAIDDFGTGYSTLSLLKDLPVRQLKIDQGFVKDMAESAKDVALVRAIIAMAHALDLTVIAEGVESTEQLEILSKEGCDEVQGLLTGRPLPSDQFAALLAQQDRHAVEATTA